jgi:hypothetical protein
VSIKAPVVIWGGAVAVLGWGLVYNGLMWLALIKAAQSVPGQGSGVNVGGFHIGWQSFVPGASAVTGIFSSGSHVTAPTTPGTTPGEGQTWFPPIGFVDSFIPGRLPGGKVSITSVGGALGVGGGNPLGTRSGPTGKNPPPGSHGGGSGPAGGTHPGKVVGG